MNQSIVNNYVDSQNSKSEFSRNLIKCLYTSLFDAYYVVWFFGKKADI